MTFRDQMIAEIKQANPKKGQVQGMDEATGQNSRHDA
jgi:hypothetical protein